MGRARKMARKKIRNLHRMMADVPKLTVRLFALLVAFELVALELVAFELETPSSKLRARNSECEQEQFFARSDLDDFKRNPREKICRCAD